MKVVEYLSENYSVALMNSKNAWRILGQETYSYEIAQAFDYEVGGLVVVVPIGNAGNITAVMAGFLKMCDLQIIDALPTVVGVQSEHANPVYLYYLEPEEARRQFHPVTVRASVAQAAMIGNPVSMQRVIKLVQQYRKIAGEGSVRIVQISEQEIMDSMLFANRNGHIACTQGGECLAGIRKAVAENKIDKNRTAILDATAHALKFAVFQDKYFSGTFEPEFEVAPKPELLNAPLSLSLPDSVPSPARGNLSPEQFNEFVKYTSLKIAGILDLKASES
jgi:threonine synthase